MHTYAYLYIHTHTFHVDMFIHVNTVQCVTLNSSIYIALTLHYIALRTGVDAQTRKYLHAYIHTQSYPYRFAMTLLYPLFCPLSFLSFFAVWGLCRYNFQAEIIMGCFGVAKPAKAPRVGGSNDLMLRLVRRSTSSKMADW